MPTNETLPIIMVGPGTGIAPFRSFWQQRLATLKAQGSKPRGPMTLFFGCRVSKLDYIYREEIEEMVNRNIITDVHVAFSREPGRKKRYVQDVLLQNSADIHRQIVHENAEVFVCGDVSMASDVGKVIAQAIQSESQMSHHDAELYVQRMRENNRYHEDIFGNTLHTAVRRAHASQRSLKNWNYSVALTMKKLNGRP